ncbi:unnamed protein product [Meganyctiphanes norvegica]|uniref:Uncharacterized protein n=1 Tax=Meganyctiphanes norvegica TaxID=48144 RepID=A0AAV2Q1Y2_MEGNR
MNSPIVYIEKIDWTSKSTEQKKQFLIEEEIRYKQMNANKLKFEETSGSMVDRGAMQLNEESGKLKNLRNFRIDLQHQRVLGTNHQESSTFCEQPSEGR